MKPRILSNVLRIAVGAAGITGAAVLLVFPRPKLPLLEYELQRRTSGLSAIRERTEKLRNENIKLFAELTELHHLMKTAEKCEQEKAGAVFRERIEQAASASGLSLKSLGEIKENQIEETASVLESSFVVDCEPGALIEFCNHLNSGTPRLYWKSITIRSSGSGDGRISVGGTLSMLNFPEESI